MNALKLFGRFEKVDPDQRMVWGYASTEALDAHGEIVARQALEAALPGFMRFGNIREMHQPSAVGKAKEAGLDAQGLYLGVKVVDDAAWAKVKEGVYAGFSIAGQVTARDPARPHVITGCTLDEISLVDRPANPEAVFTMFKSAPLAKEGRRHSAADLARLQAIHDGAVAMGAACPGSADGAAAPDADDMMDKAAGSAFDRLERAILELNAECRTLAQRVARIEAEPVPPRGAVRALAKHEDLGRPDLEPPPRTVHQLIKDALSRPHRL